MNESIEGQMPTGPDLEQWAVTWYRGTSRDRLSTRGASRRFGGSIRARSSSKTGDDMTPGAHFRGYCICHPYSMDLSNPRESQEESG